MCLISRIRNVRWTFLGLILVCSSFHNPAHGTIVQLTNSNFDAIVATNEVVFLNFYADWCRFSQILAPVFEEAAEKIAKDFPMEGKAVFGKIDCDSESGLSSRFHISKYPTLKLIRQGFLAKREFRGQRSAEALAEYVRDQLKDPIKELQSNAELNAIETKKRVLIAYFDKADASQYNVFRRVAMNLREDCDFYIAAGSDFETVKQSGVPIVFKPAFDKDEKKKDNEYSGNGLDFNELNKWATLKCIPLVREITFENAEELTEEGLPFLILFHHPDDHEILEKYNQEVQMQLFEDKATMNFLTADGVKFAHPLHHLGKAASDLPLIAIDSFRHMYLFPDIKQMSIPGKLKQFTDDLHSGKLHREFHYGPDQTTEELAKGSDGEQDKGPTTPPESTFRKLQPSRNRYTLLRDEL